MFDHGFYQYIDTIGIQYKERNGDVWLHHCPFCEANGKTKEPFKNFSFSAEHYGYYCNRRNHCSPGQGSFFNFKLKRGDINLYNKKKVYKTPVEKPEYTSGVDKFYEWYEKTRFIPKEILKKYKVGYKKYDSKRVVLIYQYYNEKNKIVNRRYKLSDKSKLWSEKDAEPCYYGLQFIDFSKDYLYVVEGEDDAKAFVALTGETQVVGTSNGAGSYTPKMDEINSKFKKLILLFDNDENQEQNAGQIGARKFAKKAGIHKCFNVVLPYKDVRDCIKYKLGKDKFKTLLSKTEQFKDNRVGKVGVYRDIYKEWLGSTSALGVMTPYVEFNKVTEGIRTSEVTVVTGNTGVGKSTLVRNVGLWCEDKMPLLVMSFEGGMSALINALIETVSGKKVLEFDPISNTKTQIMGELDNDYYLDMLEKKNVYIFNKNCTKSGYYEVSDILDIIRYSNKFYDTTNIIIDHLHYFLKPPKHGGNMIHIIDEAVRLFHNIVEELDIHVFLLVHPPKMSDKDGKVTKPGLYGGKGSSTISQEADNFWVVSRLDGIEGGFKSELTVEKNRGVGIEKERSVIISVKDNKKTYFM